MGKDEQDGAGGRAWAEPSGSTVGMSYGPAPGHASASPAAASALPYREAGKQQHLAANTPSWPSSGCGRYAG